MYIKIRFKFECNYLIYLHLKLKCQTNTKQNLTTNQQQETIPTSKKGEKHNNIDNKDLSMKRRLTRRGDPTITRRGGSSHRESNTRQRSKKQSNKKSNIILKKMRKMRVSRSQKNRLSISSKNNIIAKRNTQY